MNITKKLNLWQKEGFIDDKQKNAILAFENSNKKPKLFYTILAIAFFSIGIGVISIIASNWGAIPGHIKISADLLLLSVAAYYIYDAYLKDKSLILEGLLILYPILIIASIGLVGQVFHLAPSGYKAALFWSVMVAPLLMMTKKSIVPFVWFIVAYYSISSFIFDIFPKMVLFFSDVVEAGGAFAISSFMLLIPSVLVLIYQIVCKNKESNLAKSALIWVVLALFVMGITLDFIAGASRHWGFGHVTRVLQVKGFVNNIYAGLVLLSGALIYLSRRLNIKYIFAAILSILLFSWMLFNSAVFHGGINLFGCISSMVLIIIFMIYAYKNDSFRLFNFGAFLIGLRVFIIYIQLFGGLLMTGLGLVISGLVLIFLLHIWRKYSAIVFKVLKEAKNEK